jgi:hypothetical protein
MLISEKKWVIINSCMSLNQVIQIQKLHQIHGLKRRQLQLQLLPLKSFLNIQRP